MSDRKRIVIVGGVAGGAAAATRARRLSEDAEIILLERGRNISFANCGMPYHIGGAIADRDRLLVQTPEGMRKRYRLDVSTRTEAVRINPDRKTVTVRDLDKGAETEEPYDALVLSPGAEPIRPPIPGATAKGVFTLRGLEDMDAIKGVVDREKPSRAVVVGGGYIGLEMAEALRQRGVGVTLVELAEQVFVAIDPEMAAPIHQELEMHGVDLRLGTSITAIGEVAGGGLSVRLSTGEAVDCGLVILAVGVRPESRLAREAGLAIGPSGGIVVDEHMRTSEASIYAVGDAVEVGNLVGGHRAVIPLAGPAGRQGRVAADNIFGRPSVYRSTQGTAICKVFNLAVGVTGMSEKALSRAGRKWEKVYVHPSSHAGYYPGASQMSLKLLFDPESGKVLGAQAVGADGVDKRIDVLAVAIRGGLTVEDLAEQELAYAPPFGSAKDPVNYAGFVASNVRSGDGPIWHAGEIAASGASAAATGNGHFLLDVRTASEVQAGTIPGAKNIPVDELRGRLGELPRDKEVLAFCQVGLRGYLACRIMLGAGIRCRNLIGGYKTYKAATAAMAKPKALLQQNEDREMKDDTGAGSGCDCAARQATKADASPRCTPAAAKAGRVIDARTLQCPGPIMRLKKELDAMEAGESVSIVVSDHGFPADVKAWCHSTGHTLAELAPEGKAFRATIVRAAQGAAPATGPCGAPAAGAGAGQAHRKTIVCFSGDFDKAMATFIIANGAAAMGSAVTIFFTFWGLNVLRRGEKVAVKKNLVERMFGWMMPRGAGKVALSKMHMAGMGTAMMKGIMRKKNVASLPELIESAKAAGVRLVACTMSMDLMGIHKEELIDGVEEGGVAAYLDSAEAAGVNLFI